DGDRERSHAAFSATELPYAETAWSRTERELDARVDDWVERAHESCTATGPGNACIERARVELQRTIAVLTEADATTVTHAGALMDGLAGEDCRAPASAPLDPARRAALVAELATAKATRRAGHDASARTQLHAVIDRAQRLGDAEILREAQLELAVILPGFADDAGAIALLTDVAYSALADEDDELALAALTRLVLVEGSHRGDREAGLRWERDATAVLVRLGSPAAAAAQLDRARAALHLQAHESPEAIAAMRSVLAHAEANDGPESRATALALRDLGLALYLGDALAEARDSLERSLAIRERVLGDDHPEVAASLDLLFAIEQARGDTARALALARRVVPLYERVRGPDHLDTINARLHLGSALEPTDAAAARDVQASAVEALVRVAGADHPHVPGARMNLAKLDSRLGRFTEAIAGARAAHDGFRALYGDDDIRTVAAAIALGESLRRAGRRDEARGWLSDALARSDAAPPARRAAASDALARLEYDAGHLARAAALFEAGAAGWAAAYGPDHDEARASTRDAAECRAELAARGGR
ncbi:MAG TPA: tetratricopeptide repeat protein, partial [Nannocystaceae bacterium]|nr:tetratricopeptide repeat protein [Nannocystaceae bacterium]